MKNKPQKHKTTNTFRYKTFAEHVNEIDIRRTALYYIGHVNEEAPEEENETHFSQALRKWSVLNLTEQYHQFAKKCQHIVTLPQLLHNKDFIVNLLLENLTKVSTLSLQPLLEILVATARDLREEFYPYFQEILGKLIQLIDTQDAEQLKWTLVCLAFLFKTLKPFLRRNIDVVLRSILPILDESKSSEHIVSFAVECFAFIARDIKDYEKLLKFIGENIKSYGALGITAMGRLFFEIVRGVNGDFHSVGETFFEFIFNSILMRNYKKIVLFEIVEEMIENVLNFIRPENISLLWNKICNAVNKSLSPEIHSVKDTNRLVSLMKKIAEWKDGKFLNDLPIVIIVKNLVDTTEDKDILLNTSQLVCTILLSTRAKISQIDTSQLIRKILEISSRPVFEAFIINICMHPQFGILILPKFLNYFEQYFDSKCLDVMAKVILQKSPLCGGINLDKWKKYPIAVNKMETKEKLWNIVNNFDISTMSDDESFDVFLLATIIAPHVIGINELDYARKFMDHISKVCKIFFKSDDDDALSTAERQKLFFFLTITLESCIRFKGDINAEKCLEILELILPFCSTIKYILALKLADFILSYTMEQSAHLLSLDLFNKVHQQLSNNLCSPIQEIRLISGHALSCFCKNKVIICSQIPVYKIFYDAETITPTVHTYRDHILYLQKISVESELFKKMQKSSELKGDCLKFLLGLLYYNFRLLWEPVMKIIEEYANEFDTTIFWDVFKMKLIETADVINGDQKDFTNTSCFSGDFDCKNDNLKGIFFDLVKFSSKTDFVNYRKLLWSCIPKLGNLSEVKNRDIVTIFLKFIEQEYKKIQENSYLTWNILVDEGVNELEMDTEEIENVENIEMKTTQKINGNNDDDVCSTKEIILTLITKLETFKKLVNPKQIHRERELYEFYLELLSNTNPQLQKLGLDCIMSYKNKSLTPYKDHLYGFVDEKKFKDSLINLKIDKDSNAIQSEHRREVLIILLRILYGNMISKKFNKNMSSQMRKSLILRFLGGCDKNEIFLFLRMPFGIYEDILKYSFEDIPKKITEEFTLQQVWSPKKMQSTINTLEMIRKEFGGLMDYEFLEYLLKLHIFVGTVCENVLQHSDRINTKITAIFKNLKSLCLLGLVNFFDHFQDFNWNEEQILTIFKVFIWPRINKLPYDSIHSPTPMMKLFFVWSQNVRYFWLLTLNEPSNIGTTLTPINAIVDLLLNQQSKRKVCMVIMEIIEKLLITENPDIESNLPIVSGTSVIMPHILKVLDKFHATLKLKGTAKRGLDKRELNILAQLTKFVEDPQICESLLDLLLPILITKSRTYYGEDTIEQVIQTISNLLNKIEQSFKYIRKISPLFQRLSEVSARKQLCTLLLNITRKYRNEMPKLLESAKIINQLNAWDKRWIEQPDYDARLKAISILKRKLNENDLDIELGLLTIYNCFYFIKYDKDMGLRDNSSEFLRLLIPKLVEKYKDSHKDIDYFIEDVTLNLIRDAIRDKNDTIRNESIQLLGEMVRECPKAHVILDDLICLTDKNDREVDFFDNITHLQSHRHGRALLKFCSISKSYKSRLPNPRTLTQFILPLATRYLLNEKFATKHTLVDAAIETIGVVCQLLPWHHYHAILKFYLQKMRYNHEYSKQLIRIVVAILDAFHFDLSSINNIDSLAKSDVLDGGNDQKDDAAEQLTEQGGQEDKEDALKDPNATANEKEDQSDLDSELDEFDDNQVDPDEPDLPEHTSVTKSKTTETESIRITRLSPSNAKSVIQIISRILIPTLNNSITSISSYDTKHKLNRRKRDIQREEEEILRVPIALALVKLLQKLPNEMFETSLPGVFMKVCTFLKSPLKSVRMCARDILKKIMLTIGTGYLSILMDKLTSLLTRGFQVHVLSVTVHGVLDALKEQFKPGDLESCLQNIIDVTVNDIFGDVAAEKEIEKIGIHTPEAKPSAKSYLTLHIIARNIQESCLIDLLMPFKEHLAKSQSRKVISKIQECFQKIVTGIVENKNISQENLLIFIYGILSESIIDLLPGRDKPILTEIEKERIRRARPDCFLIPVEPKSRSGAIRRSVKTNSQANAHVLIELGLEMLHIILKRKKIIQLNYEPFLNPLIPLIRDSLKSTHVRVTTFSLKCLSAIWNGEYEIEAAINLIDELVEQIFIILHKYTSFGITKKDDNFHMIKSAFKSMVALLRKCEYYTIKDEYVIQLILYIEQDIHESEKQPIAFSLLKALVTRKVICPEIHDIMKKLCDLSIISESNYAREEARNILIIYLMEYPLQKKIDSILKFFTIQLNYSVPTGRLSAIEFLRMVVKQFPNYVLGKKCEFLFLSLGTRMVNEDVPECRATTAECIEELIARLNDEDKQKLFDINLLFFDGDKPSVREMAAILCSRFVVQEKENFFSRAKIILPLLTSKLYTNNPKAPGRFVKVNQMGVDDEGYHDANDDDIDPEANELHDQQKQRAIDHEIIQIQNCILKIMDHCPNVLKDLNFDATIDDLGYESQRLLAYEHEWVRLNAAKILEKILSSYDFDLISRILLEDTKPKEEFRRDFLYLNPEVDLKSLTLDLCAQMIPGVTNEIMAEQVVKVLLFIANILKGIIPDLEDGQQQQQEQSGSKINLNWLIRRIRYIIHGEIAKASHSCILRTAIFNWMEGLIALLDTRTLEKISHQLLTILVREMSEDDQNIDPQLRQHAIRLGNKIRKRIGEDFYNKIRTNIQNKLMIKRAERRKQLAQEKISDPVKAAKRKFGQQERKKLAKRKKMDVIKGKIAGKKRKRKLEDDELFVN